MTRRLVGWRVRWEWLWLGGWNDACTSVLSLVEAWAIARRTRAIGSRNRNVRVMKVWRVKR